MRFSEYDLRIYHDFMVSQHYTIVTIISNNFSKMLHPDKYKLEIYILNNINMVKKNNNNWQLL